MFAEIKTDFNKHIRSSFGDYVQTFVPESDNSLSERTNGCIALSPSGDKDGSVLFFHLKTRKIIKRSKWISLPINQDIIDIMNGISKDKNSEMIFEYQNQILPDDEYVVNDPVVLPSKDNNYQLVRSNASR